MATKLSNLRIDELSGVRSPANEMPGWLVMKAKEDPEGAMADLDAMESAVTKIKDALEALEPYLEDADDEVRKAHETLQKYAQELLGGESQATEEPTQKGGAGEATPEPDPEEDELTKAVHELTDNMGTLSEAVGAVLDRVETLEGGGRQAAPLESPVDTGAGDEDVTKSALRQGILRASRGERIDLT